MRSGNVLRSCEALEFIGGEDRNTERRLKYSREFPSDEINDRSLCFDCSRNNRQIEESLNESRARPASSRAASCTAGWLLRRSWIRRSLAASLRAEEPPHNFVEIGTGEFRHRLKLQTRAAFIACRRNLFVPWCAGRRNRANALDKTGHVAPACFFPVLD